MELATNGNPSMRESESNNKSVAIPSKGKVSPLIHPGNPSRRKSESINISKSARGNPSKGESESHNNTSKSAHGNPIKGKSKSTSTSNVGRFVATRGTGSNAPASVGGHGNRPAWPCAEDVQEDEKPDGKEAGKNEPQQRANPVPFTTSRIPKSVGPVVEELSSAPLSARQLPQKERAYQMPSRPARQLTKRDLGAYDRTALSAIEAVANSAPYLVCPPGSYTRL